MQYQLRSRLYVNISIQYQCRSGQGDSMSMSTSLCSISVVVDSMSTSLCSINVVVDRATPQVVGSACWRYHSTSECQRRVTHEVNVNLSSRLTTLVDSVDDQRLTTTTIYRHRQTYIARHTETHRQTERHRERERQRVRFVDLYWIVQL